jgi:hypothetical protein
MAIRTILGSPSELTPAQRAEYEAQARREWEERFIARIASALMFEPELTRRIVAALADRMRHDDKLASRVRKALPKRRDGRPASIDARRALQSFSASMDLLEANAPGKRGNRARAVRDAAAASGLSESRVERLISLTKAKVRRKSNTRG